MVRAAGMRAGCAPAARHGVARHGTAWDGTARGRGTQGGAARQGLPVPPQRTQHSPLQQWGQKRAGGLDSPCAVAALELGSVLGSVLIGPPIVARCFPLLCHYLSYRALMERLQPLPAAPALLWGIGGKSGLCCTPLLFGYSLAYRSPFRRADRVGEPSQCRSWLGGALR